MHCVKIKTKDGKNYGGALWKNNKDYISVIAAWEFFEDKESVLHEEEVIIPWKNVESAIGELCVIGAWNNGKGVLGRPDYKKQWEDNYGNSSTA